MPGSVIASVHDCQSTISSGSYNYEKDNSSWCDMTQEKVLSFSVAGQVILKLCAFLGRTFDLDSLQVVAMNELLGPKQDIEANWDTFRDQTFMEIVHLASDERLICQSQDGSWRFTNGKLQTYIYKMVPTAKERPQLHVNIGHALNRRMSDTDDESLLLLVTSQLNRGSLYIKTEKGRLELADYNLRAGKRARSMHELANAVKYFSAGIDVLRRYQSWEHHYELILDLHLSASEMYYCTGQLDMCRALIDVVMWRGMSLDDKSRAYRVQFDAFIAVGNFAGAKDVGMALMKHFGFTFPKKPTASTIASELKKTKRKLTGVADKDLLSLPICSDQHEIFAMSMLERMTGLAYLMGDNEMMVLTNLMLVGSSCNMLYESSCPAFAAYGCIMAIHGYNDQAFRFGFLSLKMLDLFEGRSTEARSVGLINSMILIWKDPLDELISLFNEGYLSGIRTGHLHQGLMNRISSITIEFASGTPLHELNYQSSKLVQEMKYYGQSMPISMVAPLYNMFLALQGINADLGPVEQYILDVVNSKSKLGVLALRVSNYCKLWFAYLAEDYRTMEKMVVVLEANMPPKAHFMFQFMVIILGLTYFELYHTTKNRVFLREARKNLDMVTKWFDLGAEACRLPAKMMATELNRVRHRNNSSSTSIRRAYLTTIDMALSRGNVAWAALTAERGATALLERNETTDASVFVHMAITHCKDWGAFAKVELLEIKYAALFGDVPDE